uniref:Proton-coupled amino acid transporter 3 n=1 Tax=Phallusia mammillata TaxID=59560 RepID=A0A6F9DS27_9ASCI|nr:proton-coupled amino acid transporter 3 [Phallusia mammillata]
MHGSGAGTRSSTKVFGNIFISFIGAGVLGLPYAFKEAGILEGTLIMSFVGYLSVQAMLLLIDCKDQMEGNQYHSLSNGDKGDAEVALIPLSNGMSKAEMEKRTTKTLARSEKNSNNSSSKSVQEIGYGDVGYFAMGNTGATLVDVAIVVSQTGFCCAYLIFITENVAQYFSSMDHIPTGEDVPTTMPGSFVQRWALLILMLPLCCLCFLRHLHKLALFSLFADFANVFAYSIVFWFDFEHAHTVSVHPKEMDLSGFPFFAGMAVYCYEGAGMILSLEGSMAIEVRSQFRSIFKWAMLVITTLYIVFGVCGYMSFGPVTNQIITLNLPAGIFPLLVKMCLCFSLFFTYPVMMFPVVQILEKRCKGTFSSYIAGNFLRAGMVAMTGLVVLIIPSFSTLMSLVGATCCSLLAFIMPALFHLRIFRSEMTLSKKVLDYTLIVVGVCATIIGTIDSLKRLGIIPSSPEEIGTTETIASVFDNSTIPTTV